MARMYERRAPKLRWYQFTIRSLLLLIIVASTTEGIHLMEQLVIESDDGTHTKVRLGEIAEIKIEKQPKQVVWRYPSEPADSGKKQP